MNDLFLQKCPVCRARFREAQPLDQPCHRCGSDLHHIRACYRQARHWQDQARRALAEDQTAQALAAAWKAVTTLNTPATRQTLTAALAAAHLSHLSQRHIQTLRS